MPGSNKRTVLPDNFPARITRQNDDSSEQISAEKGAP